MRLGAMRLLRRAGPALDDLDFADAVECLEGLHEREKTAWQRASVIAAAQSGSRPDDIAPWAWTDSDGSAMQGTMQHTRDRVKHRRGKNVARVARDKGITHEEAAALRGWGPDDFILP